MLRNMKAIILASIFLLVNCVIFAQGFYNKGGVIGVAPQTIISLPDSLVNTGTLTNSGNISVSGSWVNTGTYNASSGQINFDNSGPQTINHSDRSMGKLVISGGG